MAVEEMVEADGKGRRPWWQGAPFLILGVLWIAANLRGPMTGISPVLDVIQQDFGLSRVQVGFITALPLIAMAIVSPLAAGVAARIGLERALMLGLVLIGSGVLVRAAGALWTLYLGMWLLGAGIAFGNVLLPGLLKRSFPQHIAALTGAYAITMGAAAALASAIVVPLAIGWQWGWQLALASLVCLPAIGILLWLPPTLSATPKTSGVRHQERRMRLWRQPLAWQVTFFIALNSLLYYVLIGWLPALMAGAGYTAEAAGNWHGVMQLTAGLPGLVLAAFVRRLHNQQAMALLTSLGTAVTLLGLWAMPSWAGMWSALFGLTSGAAMMLGLVLVGLRSASPLQAASLAGMAQSVAYCLAAIGPPLTGGLFEISGSWGLPLGLCAGAAVLMGCSGWLAGRNLVLQES